MKLAFFMDETFGGGISRGAKKAVREKLAALT